MPKKIYQNIRKYLFFIVTFGGLLFIWGINLVFFLENPGFVGIALHPYLLLVIVVAALEGFSRAVATSAIVSLSYGVSIFFTLLAQQEPASRIFQYSYFSPFISFLVLGSIIGLIANIHKKNLLSLREDLEKSRLYSENLHNELTALSEKNTVLIRKCVTERELLTMLYNTAKKLSSLNMKEMQEGILDILHETVEAEKLALYMMQGDKLILCAARGYGTDQEPAPPQSLLKMIIDEKKVISLNEVARDGKKVQNPVFILAPLSLGQDGDIVGVVWIEEIPFVNYTPLTIRLVTLVADWASLSLANIFAFEALKKKTDEKNQKIQMEKIFDSLIQKYKGVFGYGTSLPDIEKEIRQKLI
jgi:hypothetical protein